ncbi:hypothetical protein C8A05DRAFT_14910 [Staphylotrichum tortipilum]|uniref:Aminoglycoside phosphotransferase domain-containing protein n=1 Tax=Staphylotrichum tortipilum TaxID=2831512 RepID=A0AAN6RUL6_9PEZI|nr:hypothetical protein C8A05DRAFT_14910 [Staphylotrichum longicolle]
MLFSSIHPPEGLPFTANVRCFISWPFIVLETVLKVLWPFSRVAVLLRALRPVVAPSTSTSLLRTQHDEAPGIGLVDACSILWVNERLHGSFNVCIPIYVNGVKRVMIRFPLPYKVGELAHPGNAAEKLRTEVATYAWIQTNCPDVPITRLWGFSFPGGSTFTELSQAPFLSRLGWYLRGSVAWLLRHPLQSSYVLHPHHHCLSAGYILVDYVDNGQMLSATWQDHHGDDSNRHTLFRDLSCIILSLAQLPFPRIGSLTMNNQGILSLTNRPPTQQLHQLENEGIPTHIPRDRTYETADAYFADVLACNDSRLLHHPNSVLDEPDALAQLPRSPPSALRTVCRGLTSPAHRHGGPLPLALTDLHPSNIFVSPTWHITALTDLERACALPHEMTQPPWRLSAARGIDMVVDDEKTYRERCGEFVDALEEAEEGCAVRLAERMRKDFGGGGETFWYVHALQSFSGAYHVFVQHLRPLYAVVEGADEWGVFDRVVAPYWGKIGDRQGYLDRVRAVFGGKGRGSGEGCGSGEEGRGG